MVHGGGLIAGDKENFKEVCKEFAKLGFVAVTINYRLSLNCRTDSISEEKAKYRAQQDVNAAFRFVVQNATSLRVNTAWMFIGDASVYFLKIVRHNYFGIVKKKVEPLSGSDSIHIFPPN